MHFTASVAVAILAQAAAVFGKPVTSDYGATTSKYSSDSATASTTTSAYADPAPTNTYADSTSTNTYADSTATNAYNAPAPTNTGLSLTAQLRLADTAADRFALLPNDKQFVFDFNQQQPNPGRGGQLIAANRKTFPALVGTGAGMAVGRLGACGMNTLHVHPRGAELQIVVKGRLVTEMVPENGVKDAKGNPRVIRTTVGPFQMTPFYQGSVHTQFNPDCDDAIFVAAFPSEDFGTGQIANETFALTDDVIAATFGQIIKGEDIDKIRKAIPKNIALGVEECLTKCKIAKSS